MNESGGGTRPELPVVLGGRATTAPPSRQVPLRTILGSSSVGISSRRRALTWWGSVAWGVAVLGCATSAFAIRDTMFPKLGRTEAPSAWQAPTRPPASVPYSDREGPFSTETSVAPAPIAAADGTPLVPAAEAADSTSTPNDDDMVSAAAPTASKASGSVAPTNVTPSNTVSTNTAPSNTAPTNTVSSNTAPSHTVHTSPVTATTDLAPTTTDTATTTTVADGTLPDDGGNQRGRGGSAGTSVP